MNEDGNKGRVDLTGDPTYEVVIVEKPLGGPSPSRVVGRDPGEDVARVFDGRREGRDVERGRSGAPRAPNRGMPSREASNPIVALRGRSFSAG